MGDLADFYHNDYAEHMDNALDERNISYDKNGNILTLHRYGAGGGPVEDYDFYDYRYYPGTNRLKNVAGSPTAEHYRYDGLGNMIYNQNRQITSAGYDGRNLVYRLIQRQNANNAFLHHYGYDAGGLRVSRRFFQSGMTPAFIHRYVRGADGQIIAVYNGTSLMYWNIPGGLGHIVK